MTDQGREWWRDAVIYQIYPRSFQDDNGDGVGDLPGITRRLQHVADLGVDAIWLSPFFTSPQKDMGYDVSDYCDVDPLFGSLEDFDALIAEAHRLGLKVIIDQVLSHTSDKHPWFEESRASRDNDKADWYVWADVNADGSPPNNWPSVFGGPAWEFEPRRGQYYLHNFLIEQPDLNFHNPAVQDAILETCKFWLDRGVDGFRLDTVNYYFHDARLRSNPPAQRDDIPNEIYAMQDHLFSKTQPENIAFLKKLRALTDQYDDRMMVGEVGEDGAKSIQIMGDYTAGSDRLHMAYSFAMLSPNFSVDHMRTCIEGFQKGAPDGHPSWSFSNHDVQRHVSRWADHAVSSDAIARQACAMLMSFEGTIGIYQGEELGQTEAELVYEELTDPPAIRFWPGVKGRDGCRTPMVWEKDAAHAGFSGVQPWLPVKPAQAQNAVDTQGEGSVLEFYKEAIAFRKGSSALRYGSTKFHDAGPTVLAFTRASDDQMLTCLFNMNVEQKTVALGGTAEIVGPHAATLDSQTLILPGNGFVYLQHDGTLF
ncbi:alpha-amylase family glycosyl hydrolase [Shimia ponticola]|uniref:alpha-amylase family glycosyl hydrolase n=1 Tax=Shimia ponticola TaxID=2582893 RepID=UPI0011BD74AC|nr:alpha-amylase family glycosyl hydrolase [Shimia ponticola]